MATTQDPLATSQSGNSVKEKLTGAASTIRDTASQYGRSAADQIDKGVHSTAGALQSTAEKLRSQTPQGGRMSDIAQTAATKLDSTAQALQNFDTRDLMMQMETWTRKNPGMAIGGALAVGFFIGMTLRKDNYD